MTKENMKRLYEHYVATNQTARADEILSVNPELKEVPKEIKEKKEK